MGLGAQVLLIGHIPLLQTGQFQCFQGLLSHVQRWPCHIWTNGAEMFGAQDSSDVV